MKYFLIYKVWNIEFFLPMVHTREQFEQKACITNYPKLKLRYIIL